MRRWKNLIMGVINYNYRPGTMELFSEQRVSQIFLAEELAAVCKLFFS